MSDPLLITETEHQITTLTLNRPARRNALSHDLLSSLKDELATLRESTETRVIVLAAAGSAFCAGHDLNEMLGRPEQEYRDLFELCSEVMQLLRSLPQPVIAKIDGMATAAGCQLVAACDLAIATDESRFATPGVRIGLFCTTPMVPLVRAVPAKVAMEMLLTGQPLSAQRAYEVGLINRVVAQAELDETVMQYCEAVKATSAMTIRLGKAAFYRQLSMNEADAYCDAVHVMTDNILQHDAQEGMSSFLEKRQPQWTQA